MISRKLSLSLSLVLLCFVAKAQVNGAQFAFEYLRLPNSPHVTALGGINVANPTTDITLALQNPALMRPALHNQVSLNYNNFYSGISNTNVAYGYYAPKLNTAFALGVQYLNYGSFVQTDNVGNQTGTFKASDYAISLAAAKQYKERWRYGATLKMAQSKLAELSAAAVLADVGIAYEDTANFLTIGAVAKNMGFMAKQYTPGKNNAEPLPFDLQLGISKRFKHLPLRLFTTVHHLYEWDVRYDNPEDQKNSSVFGSSDTNTKTSKNFADKLFRHFIFGGEVTIAKRIGVTVAYNHMRRKEMAIDDKKGGVGYSFGASIYLNKFQIHYARSFYSIAGAYNEFGLNLALNKFVGGNSTWKAEYPDWEQ
ncbi:MAG: type IX secretion system protein PorQ [Bacteroidota bacterium]